MQTGPSMHVYTKARGRPSVLHAARVRMPAVTTAPVATLHSGLRIPRARPGACLQRFGNASRQAPE
eukprot:1867752-Alexandrium_andersonii.AAC.1